MNWLVEQPLPILIGGIVVAAGFAAAAYSTGRGVMLWGLLAAALVTAALLALEHFVVTDVERIEDQIYSAAAAVQNNDLDGVLAHVSPQAAEARAQIEAAMPPHLIRSVSVKSNLKVVVHVPARDSEPMIAEASFNCVIDAARRDGAYAGVVPKFFVVRFRKEAGQWLVTGYEMRDPREGF